MILDRFRSLLGKSFLLLATGGELTRNHAFYILHARCHGWLRWGQRMGLQRHCLWIQPKHSWTWCRWKLWHATLSSFLWQFWHVFALWQVFKHVQLHFFVALAPLALRCAEQSAWTRLSWDACCRWVWAQRLLSSGHGSSTGHSAIEIYLRSMTHEAYFRWT